MNFYTLLNNNQIKATSTRIHLLEILANSPQPMQAKEIEKKWDSKIDRVTLYRTLKTLVEKKIIHKIEINEYITCYNFIGISSKSYEESDHAHFHCSVCDKVICLHNYKYETKPLPGGYIQSTTNVIIEGICILCNKNKD